MFEGTIASLTPTVCGLFGVEPPVLSSEPMLPSIDARRRATLGEDTIDRCLVYSRTRSAIMSGLAFLSTSAPFPPTAQREAAYPRCSRRRHLYALPPSSPERHRHFTVFGNRSVRF